MTSLGARRHTIETSHVRTERPIISASAAQVLAFNGHLGHTNNLGARRRTPLDEVLEFQGHTPARGARKLDSWADKQVAQAMRKAAIAEQGPEEPVRGRAGRFSLGLRRRTHEEPQTPPFSDIGKAYPAEAAAVPTAAPGPRFHMPGLHRKRAVSTPVDG